MHTIKWFLFKYIIPPIGFVIVYIVSMTIRITHINREKELSLIQRGISPIYSFWHGRLFLFPFLYKKNPKYTILVSPSIDGEIINGILKMFGYLTIRGSSFKRGKSAFLMLVRRAKAGNSVVLIGDGSRGPRYKLQDGVVRLAKLTGRPIIPIVFSAKKKKVFNSWDHFLFPYPFTKAVVIYGEPLYINRDVSEYKLEDYRKILETRMEEIRDNADSFFTKGKTKDRV